MPKPTLRNGFDAAEQDENRAVAADRGIAGGSLIARAQVTRDGLAFMGGGTYKHARVIEKPFRVS